MVFSISVCIIWRAISSNSMCHCEKPARECQVTKWKGSSANIWMCLSTTLVLSSMFSFEGSVGCVQIFVRLTWPLRVICTAALGSMPSKISRSPRSRLSFVATSRAVTRKRGSIEASPGSPLGRGGSAHSSQHRGVLDSSMRNMVWYTRAVTDPRRCSTRCTSCSDRMATAIFSGLTRMTRSSSDEGVA